MSDAAAPVISFREPVKDEMRSLRWGKNVWHFSARSKVNGDDHAVEELIDLDRFPMASAKQLFRQIAKRKFKKAAKNK